MEDLKEGLGVLEISKVLKGETSQKEVKVQFSNRYQKGGSTKQAQPPKYWYDEGQEGIWLLTNRNQIQRYDLRRNNLFYDKKWDTWIVEKLIALQNREWTTGQNGLAGSVIIDDAGPNKLYRFFYLCLRNDSKTTLFINTHYRIRDNDHSRYAAVIKPPRKKHINMINGNHPDCRLAGEPGWAIPTTRDFVELKPEQTIYLLASGDLRCFFRNPTRGIYSFQASYNNYYLSEEINGKIWKGKIKFPVVEFSY